MFVVVVDFTEPYVSNTGGTMVKVKVIDESYNRAKTTFGQENQMQSVSVLYFRAENSSKDNLPNIISVGDIIRIRRFKFVVEDTTGKVIGNEMRFSNWMIFDLASLDIYCEK